MRYFNALAYMQNERLLAKISDLMSRYLSIEVDFGLARAKSSGSFLKIAEAGNWDAFVIEEGLSDCSTLIHQVIVDRFKKKTKIVALKGIFFVLLVSNIGSYEIVFLQKNIDDLSLAKVIFGEENLKKITT